MLGSLHTYRRWIGHATGQESLSLFSHGIAGAMAGFTVSFIASPIEHVKARLQVQYSAKDMVYRGPISAYRKIVPTPRSSSPSHHRTPEFYTFSPFTMSDRAAVPIPRNPRNIPGPL